MLQINIKSVETYNEETGEFSYSKPYTLYLEHSLISISKWESKWNKPFLDKSQKTNEELLDYIRCMSTTNVDADAFNHLSEENIRSISEYISLPMTATWFSNNTAKRRSEIITSELIYYWMISYNIPSEYQKWHINRLLTLIRVCNEKNKDPKKMSKSDIFNSNKAINEARRNRIGSRG